MSRGEALDALLRQLADLRAPAARPAWTYPSLEALLLDVGTRWETQPVTALPEEGITIQPGPSRECYANAWRCATSPGADDIYYTEGFAEVHGMPVEHAWVTHGPSGKILDPTWAHQTTKVVAYRGLIMDAQFLRQQTLASSQPSILWSGPVVNIEILAHGLTFNTEGRVTGIATPVTPDR